MEWERIDDTWQHCDRPGWIDDDGVTCSKCQTVMPWNDDTGPNLVFTGLDTDTSELIGPESYVIDTAVLTDDERDILDGCEMYGAFTGPANEIIRRVGVPVADLWAAYERRRAMVTAAIEPNEITVEKCGRYSDGTWDYSVTFVFDYMTLQVSVNTDDDVNDDDDPRVANVAAGVLADHYGIIVAVES